MKKEEEKVIRYRDNTFRLIVYIFKTSCFEILWKENYVKRSNFERPSFTQKLRIFFRSEDENLCRRVLPASWLRELFIYIYISITSIYLEKEDGRHKREKPVHKCNASRVV